MVPRMNRSLGSDFSGSLILVALLAQDTAQTGREPTFLLSVHLPQTPVLSELARKPTDTEHQNQDRALTLDMSEHPQLATQNGFHCYVFVLWVVVNSETHIWLRVSVHC